MARSVTEAALISMLMEMTSEVWLVTIKATHTAWTPDDRFFVNDNQNHTIGGDVYLGFPFTITMPTDETDRPPTAQITMDNISKEIVDEMRLADTPPLFQLAVRLASSMTIIEWGPIDLDATQVVYTAQSISITLSAQSLANEPYPYLRQTPADWAGLFS